MSSPAASAPAADASKAVAPGCTLLYIANLPFALTAEELTAFVQQQANVKLRDVTIVMRKGKEGPRSRGLGFGQVSNEQLPAVLALSGKDLQGRAFDVQVAKVQIVGGGEKAPRAPKEKKERAPRAAAAASADAPAKERKPRTRKPKAAAAAGADGAAASSTPAAPKQRTSFPAEFEATHTLLYVNNLSFDATEADVSALFASQAGVQPERVELVASKFGKFKGRSRGFGFVLVKNEQVDQAVKLQGVEFQGREIGVAPAQKK